MALYAFDGTWQEDEYPCTFDPKDTNVSKFLWVCGLDDPGNAYTGGVGTRLGPLGRVMGGVFGLGGASRHVHNLTKRIFGSRPGFHYFRFETLVNEDMAMDEAGEDDFQTMDTVVDAYLNDYPGTGNHDLRMLHQREGYLFSENMSRLPADLTN